MMIEESQAAKEDKPLLEPLPVAWSLISRWSKRVAIG